MLPKIGYRNNAYPWKEQEHNKAIHQSPPIPSNCQKLGYSPVFPF
jgi:hypothetical protein